MLLFLSIRITEHYSIPVSFAIFLDDIYESYSTQYKTLISAFTYYKRFASFNTLLAGFLKLP